MAGEGLDLFPDMRAEIRGAESIGRLWIELISPPRPLQIRAGGGGAQENLHACFGRICLYAIRCAGSGSLNMATAMNSIYLPSLRCSSQILSATPIHAGSLFTDMPVGEARKDGRSLKPSDLKRFLADVRQADDKRQTPLAGANKIRVVDGDIRRFVRRVRHLCRSLFPAISGVADELPQCRSTGRPFDVALPSCISRDWWRGVVASKPSTRLLLD